MSGSIPSQQSAVLDAGLEQLSAQQVITFTKYIRVTLPLDGYVFWVNAALVSNSAIPNVPLGNSATANMPQSQGSSVTIQVRGSFHYDIERRQVDDQTYDVNRVIFTAEAPISDFNQIGPRALFLGSFTDPVSQEGTIRFAFDTRKNFYQQAGKYHYIGDAVYPDMETQIIDDLNGFDTRNVIVSNSLPIWLAMNPATPPYPYPAGQDVPMYPSYLVPDEIDPPWCAVHIGEDDTEAYNLTPYIDPATSSHYWLCKDRVKLTFLGMRNFNIQDFVDYVNNLSLQWDSPFGIVSANAPRDEKRNQDELSALAMKKSIVYEVSYNQSRIRDVALNYIKSVIPSYVVGV